MNIALKVENLRKTYGSFIALDNITFKVNEGEVFGLLGPNGAGKSTTLECIEGVKSFDTGEIEVFGESIESSNYINSIGVQLQSTSLQENITVIEAMKFFCKWKGIEVREDLLITFGLKDKYKNKYSSLSTGQKRRLHLALALANNPKLLILDEPTAGLDVEGRVSLHKEIRKLKGNGVTLILASHDMAEVEALCDRVAIIVKGKIRAIGRADEIMLKGSSEEKIIIKTKMGVLLNSSGFNHSKLVENNDSYTTLITENITECLLEILNFIKDNNDIVVDLKVSSMSLEERFMEIVQDKVEVK